MSKNGHSRRVEVRVPSREFAPGVRTALARLGYQLVPARVGDEAPDARIMAASRVNRMSTDVTGPIILIGPPRSRGCDDPRVIGVVRPPAELIDLYSLLQSALETHPRAAPRIPTALPARSLREGVDTPGAILSLSAKGCLLRSTETLMGCNSLHLQFVIPGGGPIYTRAAPRYHSGNESGLEFDGLPDASRMVITEFVTRSLIRDP